MLPFLVEFRSGEPVYEQVIFAAKKAMLSGNLPPGSRFPSVRSLSQELKINPNTAHKVVMSLTAEGLLVVNPGIGTVVAELPVGSTVDRASLLDGEVERLVMEAARLGLTENQVIAAIHQHWRKLSLHHERD
jgi:GntR family transcriptional regulator